MLGCERTFATNERDQDRIGCLCSEGITALKNHAWFSGVRPRFLFLEPRQVPALTHTATASSAVAACNLAGGLGYCGCCRRQRGASRHRTIQTEKGAYHCFCLHACLLSSASVCAGPMQSVEGCLSNAALVQLFAIQIKTGCVCAYAPCGNQVRASNLSANFVVDPVDSGEEVRSSQQMCCARAELLGLNVVMVSHGRRRRWRCSCRKRLRPRRCSQTIPTFLALSRRAFLPSWQLVWMFLTWATQFSASARSCPFPRRTPMVPRSDRGSLASPVDLVLCLDDFSA